MTISAFDVDSFNKPGFDFATAYAEGYRAGYIKLGGDNLIPRYCGSGYQNQFDAFAAQPFQHRGCYWVTGGSDPVASAQFYLAHRDPRTTFDVLDNETLDDGWSWSDAEACAFLDVLIAAGLTDLWQYGSRDSLWNQHSWPGLEARGIKAIVAIYNDAPFQNIYPDTYPAALVKGHQFTSSATIGGLGAIDENAFTDDAFDNQGDEMSQADVDAINAHTTAEINRLAEYVRRESRLRLYKNTATGQFMAASILTGRYEILSGQSEVDSLVQNGYLEIAAGDAANPQAVDQTRWDNIITKCPVDIKAITK